MILNYLLRKRATDIMQDYKKLSSNARAHKEIRNTTDCSAFKYVSRIQFLRTVSTALTSLTFLIVKVFNWPPGFYLWPSLYTAIRDILYPLNMLLTYLADHLCHYFLLWSLHSSYTGFLIPWMYSTSSCFRAFEPAFSLPIMLFLQMYAWLTPSYPSSFCPNAISSMMSTLARGLPITPYLLYFLP